MTTTVTPDSRQVPAESQAWPTPDLDPTDTTHEEVDAHSFDPTQGRKLGSEPYDDPMQGRKLGSEPYDDPMQGRKLGSDPQDDPTRAR